MNDYHKILKDYWGYSTFKPLQEDLIKNVLEGKDVLGLLPTGGGKSVTFQIPGLILEGVTLVITPLIALMKDQVQNLLKMGIKAQAIYSGMSYDQINVAINNCLYGNYKFLYISPERLGTELFNTKVKDMRISLITVDEAHCISQWGYDFRPSYLNIANIRKYFPEIPVLALTATATSEVIEDIQDKLLFREKKVLKSSFNRPNLIYYVHNSENKQQDLLNIAKKLKGSGIVYVRSRQKAKDISDFLVKNNISSTFYHAGLDIIVRSERQDSWQKETKRIVVSTNAFGMGIDKSNVRFVVHIDLPDSIEAYFQEAGRAGRDGIKSYAVLMYNNSDNLQLSKRIATNFPEIEEIKNIYQALGSYCQVPYGAGKGMALDFNLIDFSRQFHFSSQKAYSALKVLEREGYIELTEEINNPSIVKFLMNRDDLYKFQVANASFDSFIKILLRSYTGVFSQYIAISEEVLAKRANINSEQVKTFLNRLSNAHVINYIPQKNTPLIIYTEERLDSKSLRIEPEGYENRKKQYTSRINSLLDYAKSSSKCRNIILLEYFGEQFNEKCEKCDVCLKEKRRELSNEEFEFIKSEIKSILLLKPISISDLTLKMPFKKEKVLEVVQWLLDNNILKNDENEKLIWREMK